MTRKRKSTSHNCQEQAIVGVSPREKCAPRTQHEIELKDRMQCALREVREALLEASDPDDGDDARVNLKLVSELTH
ncbi:MAG: hypothetical protein M3371_07405 [Acidobacteriota bacterium]|nr:hypothetical protein [Acidobacteriota bacterium]